LQLEQLIIQAKQGDTSAEKHLYLLTYKQLYATALRYVRYDHAAKDVVQNSYIKIFKNLKQLNYQSEASTLAWMKKISVNEALLSIRKEKTWNKKQTTTKNYVVNNNHDLYKDELYAVLLKLPEQQRIVFSLFAIEGYKHKEIAEKLGINENNSRTIVGRARNFLASHITKEMIHESA